MGPPGRMIGSIYIYIYIYILVDMADTPKNIDFGDYMALGMAWYGAKYSHGVWEQFAHTFDKSYLLLNMCLFLVYSIFVDVIFRIVTFLYVLDELLEAT